VTRDAHAAPVAALDRDAAITDRRIATPAKDPRLEMLLRNLPAERRNFIQYQTAMKAVRSAALLGLAAPQQRRQRPPHGRLPRRRICRQGAIASRCIGACHGHDGFGR
jgi:hypothetical protein